MTSDTTSHATLPEAQIDRPLHSALSTAGVQDALAAYMQPRRWFRSKARTVSSVAIADVIRFGDDDTAPLIALAEVSYTSGTPETYALPLAFAPDGQPVRDGTAVARLRTPNGTGVLYDPSTEVAFADVLLQVLGGTLAAQGHNGPLQTAVSPQFHDALGGSSLAPRPVLAEQSNTSVIFGDQFIMKLFRMVEQGINPDIEIGRFLTDQAHFANTPPLVGTLIYQTADGAPVALAIVQGLVANKGDAWEHTLDMLGAFYTRAAKGGTPPETEGRTSADLLRLADQPIPPAVAALVGPYLEQARLLGTRTGQMHLALAGAKDDEAFVPAPFDDIYQHALYESMRAQAQRSFALLDGADLPDDVQSDAATLRAKRDAIEARLASLDSSVLSALRTRYHGDYHLGQVLYTGSDFMIIDFEGEPARPLEERRRKHSPLQDVAGMLRSFNYAGYGALPIGADATAEAWGNYWSQWVSVAFLQGYLSTVGDAAFLPRSRDELALLLDAYTLNKALYELAYELNNRPTWVRTPLRGVLALLG